MDERTKIIKQASWIAIIGNGILAVLKVVVGLLSNSLAVIGDGIDSTSDIIMALISLFAALMIAKPPDKKHPYGHFRAETVATITLAFIMLFVGFELIKTSIASIIEPQEKAVPSFIAVGATLFSIVGKVGLALYLLGKGKKINSSILKANGKNMQNDVIISGGVLAGLGVILIFELPIVDSVLGIGISLWIFVTAFRIIFEVITELMDGVDDQSVYNTIFEAVDHTPGAINPHRTRVRKVSNLYVIDIDIEVDGALTVKEAHAIAVNVETEIKEHLDNVYDIMVHLEPRGNQESKEKFGVTDDSA